MGLHNAVANSMTEHRATLTVPGVNLISPSKGSVTKSKGDLLSESKLMSRSKARVSHVVECGVG